MSRAKAAGSTGGRPDPAPGKAQRVQAAPTQLPLQDPGGLILSVPCRGWELPTLGASGPGRRPPTRVHTHTCGQQGPWLRQGLLPQATQPGQLDRVPPGGLEESETHGRPSATLCPHGPGSSPHLGQLTCGAEPDGPVAELHGFFPLPSYSSRDTPSGLSPFLTPWGLLASPDGRFILHQPRQMKAASEPSQDFPLECPSCSGT